MKTSEWGWHAIVTYIDRHVITLSNQEITTLTMSQFLDIVESQKLERVDKTSWLKLKMSFNGKLWGHIVEYGPKGYDSSYEKAGSINYKYIMTDDTKIEHPPINDYTYGQQKLTLDSPMLLMLVDFAKHVDRHMMAAQSVKDIIKYDD